MAESIASFPFTARKKPSLAHQRFITQLSGLYPCLANAAKAETPALALFETSARQWLFYIQSLCRIYRSALDKKPFKKIGERVKALEDQLGAVDYWDGWLKEAALNPSFPPVLIEALTRHKSEQLSKLQTVIDEGGWLKRDFERLHKICESLDEVKWPADAKDRNKVGKFLIGELDELETSYRNGEIDFKELETGVHEFRRQLRWLSIYAQSLDGLIQIEPVEKPARIFQPYLTKAVIASPFNILPKPKAGTKPLFFKAPHFYALSWLIAEIGRIKDCGLKAEAMTQIEKETGWTGKSHADVRALAVIPAKVAQIVATFIDKNGILAKLREDLDASVSSKQ